MDGLERIDELLMILKRMMNRSMDGTLNVSADRIAELFFVEIEW